MFSSWVSKHAHHEQRYRVHLLGAPWNDNPHIDETLRIVGHYQELLTQQEIDDPNKKEESYSTNEELTSLDIDDYDKDDDIDDAAEVFNGDNYD